MLAVQAATRSEEHRKALQEERMKDMQSFLAQQAQVNPRLKRLRAQQAEVQTSIAHPTMTNTLQQKNMEKRDVILPPITQNEPLSTSDGLQNSSLDYGRPVIPPIPSANGHYPPYNGYNGSWSMIHDPYASQGSYYPPPPPMRPYPPFQGNDFYYGMPYPPPTQPPQSIQPQYQPPSMSFPSNNENNPPFQQHKESNRHNLESYQVHIDPHSQHGKSKMELYRQELEQQIADKKAAQEREKSDRRNYGTYSNSGPGSVALQATQPHQPQQGTFARYAAQKNQAGQMNSTESPNQIQAAKRDYMTDLNEQIRLKKEREQMEKEKIRLEDARKEMEIANYSPYGKSGGGAPLRNVDGSIMRSTKGAARKVMELQGSDMFGGGSTRQSNVHSSSLQNQEYQQQQQQQEHDGQFYPPSIDPLQRLLNSDVGNGYQTKDVFGDSHNPFLETIKSLAKNPLQMGSTLPSFSAHSQLHQQNSDHQNKDQKGNEEKVTHLRGLRDIEKLPPWERDAALSKQKAQIEMQEALKQQMALKEAEKAQKLAKKKQEDEKEAQRITAEQELLRQRYSKELQDQKRKDEEARLENERKAAEKAGIVIQRKVIEQQQQQQLEQEQREQREQRKESPKPFVYRHISSQSPPVPAVISKMKSEIPPMHLSMQDENAQETRQVLEQLAAIQSELEREDLKMKQELLEPPLSYSSLTGMNGITGLGVLNPFELPNDTKNINKPILESVTNPYKKKNILIDLYNTPEYTPLDLDRVKNMFESKSVNFILNRQNKLLQKQEQEIHDLKLKSHPQPQPLRSHPHHSHHSHQVEEVVKGQDSIFDLSNLKHHLENHFQDHSKHNLESKSRKRDLSINSLLDASMNSIDTSQNELNNRINSPRSRRRLERRDKSIIMETNDVLELNPSNVKIDSRPESSSSFNLERIEELNQKRLKRLQVIPESKVIESFLSRKKNDQSLESSIPSLSSAFKPIDKFDVSVYH